ncbi:SRPBCC domain-containing protein [Streptomyces sp. SBR177]
MITLLTTPADRELVITRTFDAPVTRVWEAWTRPEHVRQWYAAEALTMSVCEIDLRPGGAWRWGQRGPDGQEIVFSGTYEEIVPAERLVYTELFEQMPGAAPVRVTLSFDATPTAARPSPAPPSGPPPRSATRPWPPAWRRACASSTTAWRRT